MARPDVLRTSTVSVRAVLSRRAENRLARAVGRVPVTVRTKLLVAFAVIAALLVAVGALGLRVLGQSNARVVSSAPCRFGPARIKVFRPRRASSGRCSGSASDRSRA